MPELKKDMLSVDEALENVLLGINQLNCEEISIGQAEGRVLAEDLISRLTQPPFDVSAMDGYAVSTNDLAIIPSSLTQIGESAAGKSFNQKLQSGQTVRIFTGAAVPEGANAIVIQEDTQKSDKTIIIKEAVAEGKYIRPAGLDFKKGQKLLKAGIILNSRNIALAAAMNIPWLKVTRKPRIAILSTGNELVLPGESVGPDQIISSNSLGLAAMVSANGGIPFNLGVTQDDPQSLKDSVSRLSGTDMLVTIGGASVGDYDLIKSVLGTEGLDIVFSRVAMRPGKPLIFGKLSGIPMLGLPGNPVSASVTATLFLRPAIKKMLGIEPNSQNLERIPLGCDLKKNDMRQDYLRAKLSISKAGKMIATPFDRQDSSMLANYAKAHCLIVRQPFAKALAKGELVSVLRLD
ncbi:molybdopterin molybdotransferase MoeA [Gammaproteobacteria bacterium]|nr:molybdopterin molybdotransferase MoeA [Gammaproteobacteria bacterium]